MSTPNSHQGQAKRSERGIALILVMLSLLLVSMMAAGMIFSSRSETFASYNYKLDTQADYLAKAGIQQALAWFRSQNYLTLTQGQAAADYQVGAGTVICQAGCPNAGSLVQFTGFGSGSSNYPINIVSQSFTNSLSNVRITGDSNDSGTFSVNAELIDYQSINATTCARSWDSNPCPTETWLITSQGTWTGGSGSNGAIATAVETAVIQTFYDGSPSWTNAIQAFCSVSMNGSSGTCTDAYDSAKGPYGSGSNPAGACDGTSPNIIDSGASVGSNGGVSFNGNVNVGGNVVIGPAANAPAGCPTGYSGSSGNMTGKVVSGQDATPLSVPSFPPPNAANFPTGAPSPSNGAILGPPGTGVTTPCISNAVCAGTASQPYLINNLSGSGNGSITLVGGSSASQPVYYYISSISESGNSVINVTGYVVLDVQGSISISGNGLVSDGNETPAQVVVNDACNNCSIGLSGNGAITAIINAPEANVTLKGGGSKGYMLGAIQANNVTMSGGFPLHYDTELNSLTSGPLSAPLITAYSRSKF